MSYTQENRPMKLTTPLGPDTLLLRGIRAHETVSSPFRIELDMLSESQGLTLKSLLREPVSVELQLSGGASRYFHGRVIRFVQGGANEGFFTYRAEVVPWFWLLSLNTDSRIFQNLSTQQIVEKVFQDAGFSDFEFRGLTAGKDPREYCVQYRETSFNFVSRLLEEEGIYYFFEHSADKHMMVMADTPVQHPPFPGFASTHVQAHDLPTPGDDCIHELYASEQLETSKVTLTDFNFEMPSTSLLVERQTDSKHEFYDYPGIYMQRGKGESVVRTRLDEQTAAIKRLEGMSTCRFFTSGYKITIQDYYKSGIECDQVLLSVTHEARQPIDLTGEGEDFFRYRNTFTMYPLSVPFRPPRQTRKPIVTGTQTAIVTGKVGEEITTDKYGRVKVHFHWDRLGKRDETSSCWIRVAHQWAGKRWGTIFIPRIGQEVIVDFIEGDPDRPIIVGRVYNAEQMPPYDLPGEQTKSTLKSCSSKGGDGFNELRFEDKKGREQLFLHAQRNMDVRVRSSWMNSVGSKYHMTVGGEKDGQKFGKTFSKVFLDRHSTVKNNTMELIEGTLSLTVQGDACVDFQANHKMTVKTESYQKAETAIIEAKSITLKGEGGFIKIDAQGVTIVGTMAKINSGGSPDQTKITSSAVLPEDPSGADTAKSGQPSNS